MNAGSFSRTSCLHLGQTYVPGSVSRISPVRVRAVHSGQCIVLDKFYFTNMFFPHRGYLRNQPCNLSAFTPTNKSSTVTPSRGKRFQLCRNVGSFPGVRCQLKIFVVGLFGLAPALELHVRVSQVYVGNHAGRGQANGFLEPCE